jgi:adenine-specific DNA-methyltransferase
LLFRQGCRFAAIAFIGLAERRLRKPDHEKLLIALAVDLDNKSDTFHNQWQAFRTRKDTKMVLEMTHEYAEPGEYRVVVKVIDILGNDTTKTVKVKVK